MIAGALVRHFFNAQHAGKKAPWWTWLVAGYCVAVAIWLSIIGKPGYVNQADAQTGATRRDRGGLVRRRRCWRSSRAAPCATRPNRSGTASRWRRKASIWTPRRRLHRHAEIIRVQSVLTHAMPPNNITEMTMDERRAVATWLAQKDAILH